VLFHSIGCLEPNARDGCLTPQIWSEKALSDRPRTLSQTSNHLSPRDKMSTTSNSSTIQLVFHEVPRAPSKGLWKYLATFTRFLATFIRFLATFTRFLATFTHFLATFTRFRSHTRTIEKGDLLAFATILTRLTARNCTGQRGNI